MMTANTVYTCRDGSKLPEFVEKISFIARPMSLATAIGAATVNGETPKRNWKEFRLKSDTEMVQVSPLWKEEQFAIPMRELKEKAEAEIRELLGVDVEMPLPVNERIVTTEQDGDGKLYLFTGLIVTFK
jgi:hypothetical protein